MTFLLSSSVHGSRGPRELLLRQAIPCLEGRACWRLTCDAELQLVMEQHGLQGMDCLACLFGFVAI